MTYSFLMIGQSNMAGRGKKDEVRAIPAGDKLKMLRNGRFIAMSEPVNYDRPFAGIGLAPSFIEAFSKDHPDDIVGLIPAADGGTSLEDWRVGGELYTNAVNLAKLAMRNSTLIGFLWHQGEAECGNEQGIATYETRFLTIIEEMKKELDLPTVPVIIGGLGDFLKLRAVSPNLVNYPKVNAQLCAIPEHHEGYYFVSAKGLTSNSDYLHFNSASLREFGLRYYKAFRDRVNLYDDEFADFAPIPTAWSEDNVDSETASVNQKLSALGAMFCSGKISKEEYDARQKALMAEL